MNNLYKSLILLVSACFLVACEQERAKQVIEVAPKKAAKTEGFARDTSAYAMVFDTTVHDSAINEETVPADQGGFVEYFAKEAERSGTNGHKIFYAYSDSENPFIKGYSESSSFIDLVALAYAKHYAMEIYPDDIWLIILDGFRLHVKNNRESLKDRFVAPGADTAITVVNNALTQESSHEEWAHTLTDMFDSLQAKMPHETGEPLKVKFSTTSPIDHNISRTMTMAVASEYYSFSVYTLCGIPKIRVNGKKEDWLLLKDSFDKLATQLDMPWWSKALDPVLDEFINIFDGKIDLDHWKKIYKFFEPEGCGGSYFNGWISRFFPYTKETDLDSEKYVKRTNWEGLLDFENVPKGITFIDIKWNYLGKKIPMKLYTGFIGTQVDTTKNTIKSARGYALVSYGVGDLKKIAENTRYIPGKTFRLAESLALSDSMDIEGEKGLVYATNQASEIEKFAESSALDEEYPEADSWHKDIVGVGKPNLAINLYRKGKLVDHLLYYAKPKMANLDERIIALLTSTYDGALLSLQGVGQWKKPAAIKKFFEERHIPIDGSVNEFDNQGSLPKLNVEIFVDTVILKEGKSFGNDMKMTEFRTGIVNALKNATEWRLKRLFYRYYREDFNVHAVAELSYKDEGRVDNVSLSLLPDRGRFKEDLKDVLLYGWIPPKVRTNIGNEIAAQEIVDLVKVHLAFTRDYRMVCKQNGKNAKDSVDIAGEPHAKKDLCNEITFSKDLSTGGVVRYECIEYNKKVKFGSLPEKIKPRHTNVRFNKHNSVYTLKSIPVSQVVTLTIPPCFVEED